MKNIVLLLFTTVLFSSNGFSQKAPKEKDSIAKSMVPIEGKAIVFIVRPSGYGSAIDMDVHRDSSYIGTTSAKSYLYTIVEPGTHLFTSKAENKSKLELVAEPGKIYYIVQQIKMGIMYARAHLKPVTEEEGKKFLAKCWLEERNEYSK